MKILLTGLPKIGKSTIMKKVMKDFSKDGYGIVTEEIKNENNNRLGFISINTKGEKKLFAHKKDIKSNFKIANYSVDIDVVNNFVVKEITNAINEPDKLFFFDEIGRMQALSDLFLNTIQELIKSRVNMLGTIVCDPEPWSLKFKKNPNVILVEVSEKNRNNLPQILKMILDNSFYLKGLKYKQEKFVTKKLNEYFKKGQYLQIKKLFTRALPYIQNRKVSKGKNEANKQIYIISGNKGNYEVTFDKAKEEYSCTCNLFSGEAEYKDMAGECSHIQAVQLFKREKD